MRETGEILKEYQELLARLHKCVTTGVITEDISYYLLTGLFAPGRPIKALMEMKQ